MTCDYCRSVNADDDHRCRRCGRRLAGTAVEAPPEHARRALQAVGANALAAAAATVEMPRPARQPRPLDRLQDSPQANNTQSSLFADSAGTGNVIPFERSSDRSPVLRAEALNQEALPQMETAELYPARPAARPRRAKPADTGQSTLDFLPPKPHTARLLKTTVEAAIRCEIQPASPVHRAGAAVVDAGLILASCGLFFGILRLFAGSIAITKQSLPIFGGLVVIIALFYGFVWMLADSETLGMRWADLKVVNFSGFPPDRKTRALRMAGCFLSFCSGTIGILWALVDEEGLTWHDHMSKTFPTLRDTGSPLIRQ
jgi:uncharacterized RDD family membrane protein YckC